MVVVFAGLAAAFVDQPALIFTAVVLAGVIQILLGVLRLGTYIRLVPYPVVSGFMSGIGCINAGANPRRFKNSNTWLPRSISV